MPIKKLIPKVPDPYIPKTDQAQHWPACFGHINYLIDEINNNPSGGTTNSVDYSEEIIIPGNVVNQGLLFYNINTPQMDQLIADGKYLVATGATVIVSVPTPRIITNLAIGLFIGKSDGTNWTNCFITTGGQNFFPVGGSTTSSSIQYKTGNMESKYEIAFGVQEFQVSTLSTIPLLNTESIKIILDYKAVDISWITNP
jgi:hypothetical protein